MSAESEPAPADASGPTRAGPSLAGCVQATVFVVLVLTVIGAVLAFLAAVVVVKLGVGGPRLFVGLPLIAVGSLAGGLSANTGRVRSEVLALSMSTSSRSNRSGRTLSSRERERWSWTV